MTRILPRQCFDSQTWVGASSQFVRHCTSLVERHGIIPVVAFILWFGLCAFSPRYARAEELHKESRTVGVGTLLSIDCSINLGPDREPDFGECVRVYFDAQARVLPVDGVQCVMCQLRWHAYECDSDNPEALADKNDDFTECSSPDLDWVEVFRAQPGERIRIISRKRIRWQQTQLKSPQVQTSPAQGFLRNIRWQIIRKSDDHLALAFAQATVSGIDIEVRSTTPSAPTFSIPLEALGAKVHEAIAKSAEPLPVKLDMIVCDYDIDSDSHVVPVVGIFTEVEKHESNSSAYALLHTSLFPQLSNGRMTFSQRTVIADLRFKVAGWIGTISDIIRGVSLGTKDFHLDKLAEALGRNIANRRMTDANNKAAELLRHLEEGESIHSLTITPTDIIATLGSPGNGPALFGFSIDQATQTGSGMINPIYTWAPPGRPRGDAALVVTLFFDAMQLHSIASVHNGDPTRIGDGKLVEWYSEDLGNPGQNRIVLFLPEGFSVPDMDSDVARFGQTGDHNWDDKIGSLIIRPGPKYNGHKLRIGEHPATHEDQGRITDLGIGYYSLEAIFDGDLFNSVSQLRVVP